MAAQSTSSRALLYFSERVEDATEAVKGLLGGSNAGKYVDTSDDVIRAQLESDRDEVRIDGLKTVITLISKGRDASGYFASVVKLSSNANLEIRKLVYIIVRRYARKQPDIALLGINSFQRDLQDRNEVVRAMALRVLTGLRLKVAASVVEVAISKCVRDSSFYVRKAAAHSLIKCVDISPDSRESFKQHLATLLNDRNPAVLAAALAAWSALSPNDLQALHAHFRKLCFAMGDMDAWGQKLTLDVLGHYAKRCLPEPEKDAKIDHDLDLLLIKAEDLLFNPNAAVVTSAARLIYTLAPIEKRGVIARPMTRLIDESSDISFFALLNCQYVAKHSPELFASMAHRFLPRSSLKESDYVTVIKLEILVDIAKDKASEELVVTELVEEAMNNSSEEIATAAVTQLGRWASESDDDQRAKCLKLLLQIIKDKRSKGEVVAEALNVIRRLVEKSPEKFAGPIIHRLAPMLFTASTAATKEDESGKKKRLKLVGKGAINAPAARATIYWLLGQYCQAKINVQSADDKTEKWTIAYAIALDVLRRAAINFSKEGETAKYQIVTLSTKLVTFFPTVKDANPAHIKALNILHGHILQLARYDEHFDVRDRARFCKALTDRLEVGIKAESEKNEKASTSKEAEDPQITNDDQIDDQLGGVVLRRNQVIHILFNGMRRKDVQGFDHDQQEQNKTWNTLSSAIGPHQSATIPYQLPDFFIEPWADKSTLPPSTVREPNDQPVIESKEKVQASISGDLHKHVVDTTQSSGRSTPNAALLQQANNAKTKYKDLDAFLDADSEEEEEVDKTEELEEGEDEEEESEDEYESEEEEEDNEEVESDEDAGEVSEQEASTSNQSKPTTSINLPQEENAWA
ncbi:ARM repeat-containing protein [Meira miltonrushii]|uniref:ARM repeat-containing protein n=1 Tax=Meira miltonrushii TaxID=1280837 RepID=A0A316VA92_9BASI|nr:ARM repeat-containing protein [Meira miltonrushii]PWN34382.1 ARM repeat-containing protein [Meira miltonrushii]